jgi:hypothetical protein
MGDSSDDLSQRKRQAERDLHHLGMAAPLPKANGDVGDPINFIFDMFKEARPGFDITDKKKDKKENLLEKIREDITVTSKKFLSLKMSSGQDTEDGGAKIGIEKIGIELKGIKDELKRLANAGLTEDQMIAELERILTRADSLKSKTERELLEHNFEEYVEGEKREQELERREDDEDDKEFAAEVLKQDTEIDEEMDTLEQEEVDREEEELSESFADKEDTTDDLTSDKPSQKAKNPRAKIEALGAKALMQKSATPEPDNEPEGPKTKRPRLK